MEDIIEVNSTTEKERPAGTKNHKPEIDQIIKKKKKKMDCLLGKYVEYVRTNLIGFEQEGVHKLIFQSIMKCDADTRKKRHVQQHGDNGIAAKKKMQKKK
ncbi:hypothetical protein RFI_32379 [Reticulomyxa filosa]|uniref:Uncharacterized protein n=1 Tax=Reticulomyxa filosa TaxID=46433 RepID=X6LSX8_RETFI|nr:hypothetical protein RFI_32379 [Reticulomyxa filosa]|eukprot:ETO05018.1 hypothetical protein RFI_32379 [Reticulomyxa filosa]